MNSYHLPSRYTQHLKISVTKDGLSALQTFAQEIKEAENETIKKRLEKSMIKAAEEDEMRKNKQRLRLGLKYNRLFDDDGSPPYVDSPKVTQNMTRRGVFIPRQSASIFARKLTGVSPTASINDFGGLSKNYDGSCTNFHLSTDGGRNSVSTRIRSTRKIDVQTEDQKHKSLNKLKTEREMLEKKKQKMRLELHRNQHASCMKNVKKIASKRLQKIVDGGVFMKEISKIDKELQNQRAIMFNSEKPSFILRKKALEDRLSGKTLLSSPISHFSSKRLSTPCKDDNILSITKSSLNFSKMKSYRINTK